MKMKFILPGLIALAVIGWWAGITVWHRHEGLVSLNVREVPLGDVLHKIESQTGQKIRAENALENVRITLHVNNKSFSNVLDRVAEQAGAHWATLYAVYDKAQALQALDSALNGNGRLEAAGWKRLAPIIPAPPMPGTEAIHENSGPDGGHHQIMLARRTKDGSVVFEEGANGQIEAWSPTELIIASQLGERLGTNAALSATAGAAAETALKVHGKWTTFLAFSKSPAGIGFSAMPHGRPAPGQFGKGPNDSMERFGNLTPEQRVQRERERLGLTTH